MSPYSIVNGKWNDIIWSANLVPVGYYQMCKKLFTLLGHSNCNQNVCSQIQEWYGSKFLLVDFVIMEIPFHICLCHLIPSYSIMNGKLNGIIWLANLVPGVYYQVCKKLFILLGRSLLQSEFLQLESRLAGQQVLVGWFCHYGNTLAVWQHFPELK